MKEGERRNGRGGEGEIQKENRRGVGEKKRRRMQGWSGGERRGERGRGGEVREERMRGNKRGEGKDVWKKRRKKGEEEASK